MLLASAFLLIACGAQAPAPPTVVPTPGEPVELSIYMPRDKTLTQMLDAMLQATPGGQGVRYSIQDSHYYPDQQIAELNAKGTPPDLIFLYSSAYAARLVEAGLLLDLREQMNPGAAFNPDDVDERAMGLGRVAGRGGTYALPLMTDNIQLYYNRTLMQQAKVALPSSDWTWDDLITQCQRLQSARPGLICLAQRYAFDSAYWYPWVRGYGGDILLSDGTRSTLGSQQAVAGLQRYAELWTKHKVMSPVQFPSYVDCFVGQRCAMMPANAMTSRTLQEQVGNAFEWDTQLLPSFPNGRYSVGTVPGFGIGVASKHPAAAWALLRSLVSPQAQAVLLSGGYGLPVLKAIPASAGQPVAPYLQTFLDGRAFSTEVPAYPTTHTCVNYGENRYRSAMDEAFSAVFYRKGDFAQSLPKAGATIQPCLDAARPAP